MAAGRFGMAQSARSDCISCDRPDPIFRQGEMFDWEVFITSESGDEIGPCGSSSYQATSMDELRTTMRRLSPEASVWGRITRKVYDFGMVADTWSSREIFRASVDPAGAVRFERVAP